MRSAERDRNAFWKVIRYARRDAGVESLAIRDKHDKIVHEPAEVLQVWKQHFETLVTPKESDTFDHLHYMILSLRKFVTIIVWTPKMNFY